VNISQHGYTVTVMAATAQAIADAVAELRRLERAA
jgi:hypothetical protein